MKIIFRNLICIAALAVYGTANSYELGTHGNLTYQAYKRSVLSDAQFLSDLGIVNGKNPFGEAYFDVSGATVKERTRQQFEQQAKRMPNGTEPLSVEGWLMRGAIREDDLGQILGVNRGDDPHDDPYGNIFRVFNHFYDPVQDKPLTTIAGVLGLKSPDWAVGSANAFTQPNTPDTSRRNHFTVFDAREAMYRALTGKSSQGSAVASTEADRNKYWATTFRALGDVVHLVQDMGQPQHTRNDAHSGVPGFGHKSIFEEYIEMRATGVESYNIDGTKVTPLPLTYDGYTPPAFTKYSDFWSTRNGITGRGLADYSNRGFFSAGTNLGSNSYASPSNDPASYTTESASGLLPSNLLHKINFLKGNVYDYNLNPGTANIRMTSESMWDASLNSWKTYSLNRFNYNDMADLLIPRSVAYSAGLINYFFRGKIDFVPDPDNPGAYIIKNLSAETMTGTFTLYYDDMDGVRQPVLGTTWNLTIAANSQYGFVSFTPPTSPAPKIEGEYMLVFNGDMGEEKATPGVTVGAVAVKKVQAEGFYAALSRIADGSYGEGYIAYFNKAGVLRNQFLSGIPSGATQSVAVFGGTRYTIGSTSRNQRDAGEILAYINGVQFAKLNWAVAIAVNSKGVYIYEHDPVGSPPGVSLHDGEIRHYRLDGVFMDSFPTTGFPGESYTLAANEHALCTVNGISRDDGVFTGVVYDLSGTLVTTVPLTFSEGCTLTQDRVFFGNQPSYPNWEVGVYDMQGQKQLTVPIAGAVYRIHGLTATEDRLYVAPWYVNGSSAILIYDRHVVRDGVGNIITDTFTYNSKVDMDFGVQAFYPTQDRTRFLK